MKPGDHVMHMGRCAIVVHVFDTTANIRYINKTRTGSQHLDVYISEIVTPGDGHVCV